MQRMPNLIHAPLEEPGQRSGEGVQSILPHLHRQVQTQVQQPAKAFETVKPAKRKRGKILIPRAGPSGASLVVAATRPRACESIA
jgi:hypothetical protein